MMLRLIILFALVSCAPVVGRRADFDYGGDVQGYDITASGDGAAKVEESVGSASKAVDIKTLYEFKSFKGVLTQFGISGFDNKELDQYERDVSMLFENANNGSSKEFNLKKSGVNVKIELVSSFEIIDANLFCRQHVQAIDFKIANVTFTGVACRGESVWNLLKNINQ